MADPVDAPTFRRMIARMRAVLPVPRRRIVVRRQSAPRVHGDRVAGSTAHQPRGYLITVERALTRAETVDTILHEWAHAYSGDFTHGPRWGAAYARAYRAFHGCA